MIDHVKIAMSLAILHLVAYFVIIGLYEIII